jgi:23S rRNA pseudouridine1911/1915/1917 synthase
MPKSSTERVEVVFADAHLIAVNKPGGLPAQADKTGDDHLLVRLADVFPQDHALGLPHRLDRPVSGLVLVTRTLDALTAVNMLFAHREVHKVYWAIVEGTTPPNGQWTHRLAHDARHHKARVVDDVSAQEAVVTFRTLALGERYSLIELVPEGGRFHQLRAQCGAVGFPIKGDVKYGARRGEKDRTIALHARSIAFKHPSTGEDLVLHAAWPDTPLWSALVGLANER